jgi:holliday junction DNA helicase RuvA
MIGWLRGRLIRDDLLGQALIDVGGVGYEVSVPAGTLARARSVDGEIELFVHTHVREDSLDLFAFADEIDRRVFRQLIGVPNIGPRTALGVMSALPVSDLARAVRDADHVGLARVPGIGKKTAERLVLELKGKLVVEGEGTSPGGQPATNGDARARLLSALTNMGYRAGEAERAVASLAASLGDEVDRTPLGELLKQALARLG